MQAGSDGGDPSERRLERGQPVAPSQPEPAWKWIVSIVRPWRAAAASASGMPVLVDAELRRALAAVGQAGVVAGAGGRIDPEPDRPPRIAPSEPLDLADCVEIDVDRRGQEHVEVPFGDVRAGEADLVWRPAALEGAGHLARRAGIDADEIVKDLEDSRIRVRLQREAKPMPEPGPVERRGESPGVLGEPRPVVDEERRPVSAGERLGVLAGDRRGGRHALRGPAEPTTARA